MKSIIRGLAAAVICVAIGQPVIADTQWSLWSISNITHTAMYSPDNGVTWLPVTDVVTPLPTTATYTTIRVAQDILSRRVLLVGSTTGLYRSVDGGHNWYEVSGPGSGLEATSKYFSAIVTTTTPFGTTDILVGVTGSTNGGVYLSGDGGLHWAQINQGYDPSSLNISTLAKTSCSGCPVQYYSGTYGSGVYTRTIAVVSPPVITGWCFGSTTCTCGTAAPSGAGGQPFRLCGANFLALPTVQFGWLGLSPNEGGFASGCITTSNVITCTAPSVSMCGGYSGGTPAGSGLAYISVRNTDTRTGLMPVQYNYLAY